MREITVTFTLYDAHEVRLKKIVEEYEKLNFTLSEDKIFEAIMTCGSFHDIEAKFKLHEWKLGLREDFR